MAMLEPSFLVLNLSKLRTINVTNMSYAFYENKNLTNVHFGKNFKTDNVTNMSNMFNGCSHINNLILTNWNLNKVTNMSNMFGECNRLGLINVTGCSEDTKLKLISQLKKDELGEWYEHQFEDNVFLDYLFLEIEPGTYLVNPTIDISEQELETIK